MSHPKLTDLQRILVLLTLFTYVGVLSRYGLNYLNYYQSVFYYQALYPNIVGCLLIGFFNKRKISITELYPPLYVGLSGGLCGSLTTFSGWNIDSTEVLLGFGELSQKNPKFRVITYLTIFIVGLSTSFGSFCIGRHLGGLMSYLVKTPCMTPTQDNDSNNQFNSSPIILESQVEKNAQNSIEGEKQVWRVLFLTLTLTATAAIMIVSFTLDRFEFLYMLLLAPFGTSLRYFLAMLNVQFRFPWGTFAANMLGTALAGCFLIIQAHFNPPQLSWSNDLLNGLMVGFCGSLTTVSTFILELNEFSIKMSWIYCLTSFFFAQVLLLLIVGSYQATL